MLSEDEEILRSVATHGWHVISVSDTSPQFSYTCGLITSFGHSELIIFGLEPRIAYSILSGLVDLIRTGLSFAHPGIYEGVIKDLRIGIGDVHSSQHEFYLGYAMSHSRITGNIDEFRAVQVFWPDSEGHLPNEVESDQSVSQMQPRLDREATQSEIEAFRRRWWK